MHDAFQLAQSNLTRVHQKGETKMLAKKDHKWVWCCLQPQRPSQRLVLLPTHLVALTFNVPVAPHRLLDACRTVGKRLDALPLSNATGGGRVLSAPGRCAF
jgi:hypothetical protein